MRVRGFASLIGSRALNAPYEWGAWVNWALEAGVTQATVDAIREGRPPHDQTAEEALITDFCMQLLAGNHRVSDGTFKAALDRFGTQGLVELVVTLGYFAMIALPLNAFEIGMSSEQQKLRKPFAPLAITGTPWAGPGTPRADLPAIAAPVTAPPRLPLLSAHADVAPEHQHFLDRIILTRGWISGAFQVLLHTPDVAARIAKIGAFFQYETILSPQVRTLTWLIAARELDCNYVWQASVNAARTSGVDAELIAALENDRAPSTAAPAEKLLLECCRQLLRDNHHVGETTYQAMISEFGTAATVQIAATLGYIVMLSLVANAFDIAPPPDDQRPAL
jgi:alkylhydroperoxidase family enzyme